jgi:membrane protein implicated in regulation of membrane protease activity
MWIAWLIVAIAAAIGEMVTSGFFLALIAVAAVLAGVVSLVLPIVAVQVALFAALSLLGIAVVRPFAIHALGMDHLSKLAPPVSHSYLVGRRAVVTRQIDAGGGQIRYGAGEFWSARAFEPNTEIPVGAAVEIMMVDGVTAVVEPVPPRVEANETSPEIATQKGQ